MSGFTKLPTELTDDIFSRLPRADLISASRTSHHFHDRTLPLLNRYLTITVPPSRAIDPARGRRLFEKAFSDASLQYLREIEVGRVLEHEIDTDDLGPRDVYLASNAKKGVPVEDILNESLENLLQRLPAGQLKSFTTFHPAKTTEDLLTPTTITTLFSPQNTITNLNLTLTPSTPCHPFHAHHLKTFTYHAQDFTANYHTIFSILFTAQNTLEQLYSHNSRVPVPPATHIRASRRSEMEIFIHEGFATWKRCEGCCPTNPPSNPANRRIRLTKLKIWHVEGMGQFTTDVFGPYNVLKDSEPTDVEISIGALAFVKLKLASRAGRLSIQNLLQHATGTQLTPDDAQLTEYFASTRGLESVTLNFHANIGMGWLGALQTSAGETLKVLHLGSVRGAMVFDVEVVEGIGRSMRGLEMLSVGAAFGLPACILDSTIFPRLKYFGNRAYVDFGPMSVMGLEEYMRGWKRDGKNFTTSLRLVYLRMAGQNYLIERDCPDGKGGVVDIKMRSISDTKLAEVLKDIGEPPKFG
ncbi:hypothetical protein TWF481_010267 [Arthrobotrys musiformis]|uniref:F-box domain-containing protein n=1 Tax=Arthrobotrys musiformis TaxID=47236 RepID=A0AAV9W2G3_9PEZI